MLPSEIEMFREILPDTQTCNYYPDREAAWLLAQMVPDRTKIKELRNSAYAPLLERGLIKTLIQSCGDGYLYQRDLLALAAEIEPETDAAANALAGVYAVAWQDFELTLTDWGVAADDWSWNQLSRKGGNLVLQVNFPAEHAKLLGQFRSFDRKEFEFNVHPIRETGRPTLAWVRLDICLETGAALIEEVQSDWLREIGWERDRWNDSAPQSRERRVFEAYSTALFQRYRKSWARVAMFAALRLLRQEFAIRDVFMHQPATGACLKSIRGSLPPRSIYTSLPKSFCFAPTAEAPAFLERARKRPLAKLRRTRHPLFWHLGFDLC